MEEDAHCVVCFEETNALLSPCNHRVCISCTKKWLDRSHTCPICRQTIVRYGKTEKQDILLLFHTFCEEARPHIGVTLRGGGASGVLVTWVHPSDLAYSSGLRKGHIITHINDIHVTDHKVAVEIMETARENKITLHITLLRPTGKSWFSKIVSPCFRAALIPYLPAPLSVS